MATKFYWSIATQQVQRMVEIFTTGQNFKNTFVIEKKHKKSLVCPTNEESVDESTIKEFQCTFKKKNSKLLLTATNFVLFSHKTFNHKVFIIFYINLFYFYFYFLFFIFYFFLKNYFIFLFFIFNVFWFYFFIFIFTFFQNYYYFILFFYYLFYFYFILFYFIFIKKKKT